MNITLQHVRFLQNVTEQTNQALNFHSTPLIVSWCMIGNLAAYVALLRWWKFSFYIHMFLGMLIIGLSLGSCIQLLEITWLGYNQGNPQIQIAHQIIGFVVCIQLGVQVVTGFAARFIQFSDTISTTFNIWTKRLHYFFGYAVLLLAKANYLDGQWLNGPYQGDFTVLIVVDVFCIWLFLLLKYKYWTLSEDIVDPQVLVKEDDYPQNIIKKFGFNFKKFFIDIRDQILRNKFQPPKTQNIQSTFKSQKQIPIDKYVIFNDFVYDTQPLQHLHPGGQFLIKMVNKREIDRFLYGMYSHELTPNVSAHSHTSSSLRLCEKPIGKILRVSPMSGFKGHFSASIISFNKMFQNSSIYLVNIQPSYLQVRNGLKLEFNGFTNQNQFGQYFSITISNQKGKKRCTRLYTSIWSQRAQNLLIMQNLYPGSSTFTYSPTSLDQMELKSIKHQTEKIQSQYIPLVIKKYQKGKLTSEMLDQKFKGFLVLSEPMGCGMKYQSLNSSGKVIIVCGGTGLLPFCDFIDILFKKYKHLKRCQFDFSKKDPLINEDLIKDRQFVLYCAAESHFDLPALSLFQINQLCDCNLFKFSASFRLSKKTDLFVKQYSNIELQKQYFDVNDICQIYICGPPVMSASLAKVMTQNRVNQQQYHFM